MAHYKHTVKDWSMAQNVWAEHNRYLHSLGRRGVPLGYATTLIDTGERFMGKFTDYPVLAVRQHATEVERVQVDAIVHDSVLTTLLSAARTADPAGRELAAVMAANAMGHLSAAEQGTDEDAAVPLRAVAKRIVDAASTQARAVLAEAAAEADRSRSSLRDQVTRAQDELEQLRALQHQVAEQLTGVRSLLDWTLPRVTAAGPTGWRARPRRWRG